MTEHDDKMAEQAAAGLSHRFEVDPSASNHFAWLRTRLSMERTLMAWVRTAMSLIGFGFTIVQFFEKLRGGEALKGPVLLAHGPRVFGLSLIATGVVSLGIALFQYRWLVRYLRTKFQPIAGVTDGPATSPILAVVVVLALIGIVAFGSVFVNF